MSRRLWILFVASSAAVLASPTAAAQAANACRTLDFETLDGAVPEEGAAIDTQFVDELGIAFRLEADGDPSPVIARTGSPATAFLSPFGDDTPAPDQDTGSAFLTDDGMLNAGSAAPLLVTFDSPADSASGVVLDIDAGESFTIEARGADAAVLETVTVTSGDPGTGNALATSWAFKRPTPDVTSIRFIGTPVGSRRFGLGFDNFTTCVPGRSTASERSDPASRVRLLPIAPNPSRGRAAIAFELATPMPVELVVFDVLGRVHQRIASRPFAPGVHRVSWDASSSPSGVYVVRLRANGETHSVRAVLQR